MKLKKGDKLIVIVGKDRGKTGKLLSVVSDGARVLVDGVNMYKKHRRPRRQGEAGEVVTLPRSLAVSNVQFYCASCGKGRRLGMRMEGAAKVRHCKRCGTPA